MPDDVVIPALVALVFADVLAPVGVYQDTRAAAIGYALRASSDGAAIDWPRVISPTDGRA